MLKRSCLGRLSIPRFDRLCGSSQEVAKFLWKLSFLGKLLVPERTLFSMFELTEWHGLILGSVGVW